MEIPNIKTRKEIIAERVKNGEQLIAIICDGMFGSLKNAPEYNNAWDIRKKAFDDIKRCDFGDMGYYIDSLEQLVDHYKGLAEQYLDSIDKTKYILDDYGNLEEI